MPLSIFEGIKLMQIHVFDCDKFDEKIDVSLPISVRDFLAQIREKYQYDTSKCSVFKLGKEISLSEELTSDTFCDNNDLVIFNPQNYSDKSFPEEPIQRYPKFDIFKYPNNRFQNIFYDPKIDNFYISKNEDKIEEQKKDIDFETAYFNYLQNQIDPEHAPLLVEESYEDQPERQRQNSNPRRNNSFETRFDSRGRLLNDSLQMDTYGINFTESELDTINRLCLLGFERDYVIQVFVACDRNETQTRMLLQSL